MQDFIKNEHLLKERQKEHFDTETDIGQSSYYYCLGDLKYSINPNRTGPLWKYSYTGTAQFSDTPSLK